MPFFYESPHEDNDLDRDAVICDSEAFMTTNLYPKLLRYLESDNSDLAADVILNTFKDEEEDQSHVKNKFILDSSYFEEFIEMFDEAFKLKMIK